MVGALAEVFGRSFTLHGRSFVAAPDSAEPSCGTLKAVCVRSVMCVRALYIGILVCFSVYTDRCYSSSLLPGTARLLDPFTEKVQTRGRILGAFA
jgi:hypothetical protein